MTQLSPALQKRRINKLALLVRIEDIYGEDATPEGAAHAIQANDVTFTPLAGSEESRNLVLPYLGNQGVELTGEHAQVEFSVEMGSSGARGTVPGYGSLLRACAMAEVIEEETSVEYTPISEAMEAATLYYVLDGVRHVLLGARGNVSLTMTAQQLPRLRFTLMGLVGTISDIPSMPIIDTTRFFKPPLVNTANTKFELFDAARVMQSLSLDLGNQVSPHLMVGAESIEVGDRSASGTAVLEAKRLAQGDWFAKARSRERGEMKVEHGTVAGHIVEIEAPAVEVGRPSQGQTNGIATYSLPLGLIPVAGNDEFKLTVR